MMKTSRPPQWLSRLFVLFALALPIAYLPIEASAACSDSRVKRLSRQGKTVAVIAQTCGKDVDEVRDILEEEDEPESEPGRQRSPEQSKQPRQSSGLAPGTPLAPCGCWGPAFPGQRQPNEACSSGFATPRICPQMCPAGGYAWHGVCG